LIDSAVQDEDEVLDKRVEDIGKALKKKRQSVLIDPNQVQELQRNLSLNSNQ